MEEVALFGFVVRFVYATAGLVGIVLTFKWLNRLTGRQFDDAYTKASAEAGIPWAIYNGARALGVFLYYGFILG